MRRVLLVLLWAVVIVALVALGAEAWRAAVKVGHYLAYEFANFGRILK